MKIVAMGDTNTVTGMQLTGIKDTRIVETTEQVAQTLREFSQREDVGVILITERLAVQVQDQITRIQEEKPYPIIVEIPDKEGKLEMETSTLRELVRRAVGVELEI
jgi:V/A-type H+-transporting ATPase subunit F